MNSFPLYGGANHPLMPIQMLSIKEKDKEWKMRCMDALESFGHAQFLENFNILENYRMVNNEFLYKHYFFTDSVTDLAEQTAQEFGAPPYLRNYDMIGKVIKFLSGEYQQRPDIFRVAAIDEFSVNQYQEEKGQLLKDTVITKIQAGIKSKLVAMGLNPDRNDFGSQEEQQQYQQQLSEETQKLTPASIQTYMAEKYLSVPEKWGELVIKLDKQRFNTPEMEMIEFEDMLIADRAFRHFYLKANGLGYGQETWNPTRTFFHKSPDVRYVEDGNYVGRVFYLSVADIVGRYGHKMSVSDIESLYGNYLERKNKKGGGLTEDAFFQTVKVPYENFPEMSRTVNALGFNPHTGLKENISGSGAQLSNQDIDVLFNSSSSAYNLSGLILCTEGYWRSQKKVGFLIMTDPDTGEVIEEMVDETFIVPSFIQEVDDDPSFDDLVYHPQKKMNTIRWTWVNEVWGGIKINAGNRERAMEDRTMGALYIDVRPLPFQFKGDINPFEVKLPVCGAVFNNRNAQSMSVVDLGKSYQILYNVFMNKIFQLSTTDMGKFLLLDPRMLPNDKDLGGPDALQKWVTITKETKIGQIDTSPGARPGSNYNQFGVQDLREFDSIKATVEIASLIEQAFLYQVGLSQQRLGQDNTNMTATGVMQNLRGSTAMTESWFTRFTNYKRRVLQMNLDIAQYCSVTDRDMTLSLVQDDMSREYMKINGLELLNSQLGVLVFNSQELIRQTEMLKELVLKNNTSNSPLSSLAEVIFSGSPARIIEAIKKGEAEINRQIQEKNQHEQQMLAQKAQQDQAAKDKQNAWQAEQNELDRENKIREKEISVLNFDQDVQNNGQIDVIDIGNLQLDKQRLAADQVRAQQDSIQSRIDSAQKSAIETKKLDAQKELADKQLQAKDKEAAAKQEIENKKLKQIQVQNANQIKLSQMESARAERESKNKIAIEKLKAKTAMKKAAKAKPKAK